MKPVRHPSNTRTLDAPAGWDQSKLPVEALGITDTELEGVPCVMSFWQPDDVELANIAAGGLIGLSIVGRTMPPACVVTLYPADPARADASTPWGHQAAPAGVPLEWPAYIAGIVETYLKSNPAPEVREAAIAGIIERRMWSAPKASTSRGAQYHDALQRIGTALGLPAGSDLTKACVPAIEALRESGSAPAGNGRPVLPPMTEALRDLLGTPVHTMIPLVRCLQAAGLAIPRSYEGEQAGMMHWMLGFYFEHGDDWKRHAGAELTRLQEAIRAARPAGEETP